MVVAMIAAFVPAALAANADHIDAKTDAAVTVGHGNQFESWSNIVFTSMYYTTDRKSVV